ncbi:MAG TPA: hypothetical protein VFJ30_18090, partial [Phycisphaerae bacterium]|nr:hypothetical protein [Phycisphaerae bacterium]
MRRYVAVLMALCLGLSTAAWAEDWTWMGGAGNWSDSSMWMDSNLSSGVPVAADTAIFNNVQAAVVLDVSSEVATLNLTGNTWLNTLSGTTTLTVNTLLSCNSTNSNATHFDVAVAGAGAISVTDGILHLNSTGNTIFGEASLGGAGQYARLWVRSLGTGTVTVNSQGEIRLDDEVGTYLWNNTFVMNGGVMFGANDGGWDNGKKQTVTGKIIMNAGNSYFRTQGNTSGKCDIELSGVISGPGTIVKDSGAAALFISGTTNTFSGGLTVTTGRVRIDADGAQGTGTVLAASGGWMQIKDNLTLAPGQKVIANPGGTIQLWEGINDKDPTIGLDYTFDIHLNGGRLVGRDRTYDDWSDMQGTLYVDADSTLATVGQWVGRALEISGTIVGTHKLTVAGYADPAPEAIVIFSGTNEASFSGPVNVVSGYLRVDRAGALGTGALTAAGGMVISNAAGCLDSPDSVTIAEGGTMRLNSTETAVINVLPGGSFEITGGSTTVDYTSDGNIQLSAGCVIGGLNGNAEPTLDDFLYGDGGVGAFTSGTGDITVGGTSIYRGLALASGQTKTYSGIAQETAPGVGGVSFLAMRGATWTYNNAQLLPLAGNSIKFYGAGTHVLNATTNYGSDNLSMEGSGIVRIAQGNTLASKTLNMNNGTLDLNHADALLGATVNINAGAGFIADMPPSNLGNLTIKSGGAVDEYNGNHNSYLAGLTYTLEKNSQYLLRLYSAMQGTGDLPGAGMCDYVHYFGSNVNANNLGDRVMRLSDDTRVTTWWTGQRDGNKFDPSLSASGAGFIGLATDATQARITCPSGMLAPSRFTINAPINLTGSGGAAGTVGTLVIGDTDTFNVFGRNQRGFTEISQDGDVWLENRNSVIGAIDVQAGRLMVWDGGQIGGASAIHVAAGATFNVNQGLNSAIVFSGDGTVQTGGGQTLTLTPDEGVAAGFAASGVLDVDANVSLMAYAGTTPANPSVAVRVTEASRTATVASQVAVSGNVNSDQLDVNVLLGVPSANLNPAMMADMPILTGAVVATGTVNVVMGETVGVPGDNHWKLNPAEVAIDVTSGTAVVLRGAAIQWTAVPGNANLDGMVGIADLVALAEHYGDTDVDWMDGDFNLDGVVGI